MIDIALVLDEDNRIDLGVDGGDLAAENGLRTAVLISLFTDARAEVFELPPGETDRRGWWADAIDPGSTDRTGSKLWLLMREKDLEETRERAREYAVEALSWMVEDGVAASIEAEFESAGDGVLAGEVRITKPDGKTLAVRVEEAWAEESSR